MDYNLGIICSSKAGDATHIIKDNLNGLICENNDLISYTNAFYSFKNNIDLINKFAVLNYEILLKDFSAKNAINNLVNIYKKILN